MGKYSEDSKELLRLVGGKENIAAVSHCVTRMRFVLNDPKKADIAKIEAMKAVKGTFTQAGQFQVIIGNTVSDFYNDFTAVAGTAAADIPVWDFGSFQVKMIGYQAQIIPAIMAAFTLVYLEKFFRKITPAVISMVVVPFCSLLLSVIAAHFVLGPIGWKIGSAISSIVYAGITGSFKTVFAAIFGFVYAPLVITGLHHMSNAIDMQLIADYGGTMLWPMIALSNIAQGSAVIGMMYLQKKNAEAQEVNIPAAISCYLGVTEPAIFGVNLKHTFPFVCAMVGSACAAVLCVSTGTTANAIGVGGLPGILSIQPRYMGSFALSMLIAVAVSFVLTVIVGKKKLQPAEQYGSAEAEKEVVVKKVTAKTEDKAGVELNAFVSGQVIELAEVNDGVFSTGMVGEGFAIVPDSDVVYAPADGEIAVLMEDSRHACGMKLANGVEVLLHVGIDTVTMNGDGFEYLVKAGQTVKAGTALIKFNRGKIKAAGHPDTVICIVTSRGSFEHAEFITGMKAAANSTKVAELN